MDFDWTDEQRRRAAAVRAFAAAELADLRPSGSDDIFPREAWKRCAAFGIQGLPVPEQWGGQGCDALTVVAALEALGYGCRDNALLFALNAHMWSSELPIVTFGSNEQKARYLPALVDGSLIGNQAVTEAEAGSDALSVRTEARPSGSGYVLSGHKLFVTNAPVAGLFVVLARLEDRPGLAGLCAFLVERDWRGVQVGPPLPKMGLWGAPIAELRLDGCEVPASALLGSEGAGMAVFSTAMSWERSFTLASAVGAMERQIERCVAFAKSRSQFGLPIASFQAVSHRIVDMKVRLESARVLLYRCAWRKAQGKSVGMDSAIVKLLLSEAFLQSSLDALQIHGGSGYLSSSDLEGDVRDAVAGRIYAGTSEIQRNIVARHLGL